MIKRKLAYSILVLSIFAFIGATRAQHVTRDPMLVDARSAQANEEAASFEWQTAAAEFNAAVPTAAWTQSTGPETGNPFTLLRRGQRLFQGNFGGLWFSDDNGDNWSRSNVPYVGQGVTALAANDTTIFLGANFGGIVNGITGGVYRSTNNGQTWTASNNGFPAPRSIQELVANGNNIYAVTFNGELFRSTDNGDTWLRLNNGLPATISVGLGGGFVVASNALLLRNGAENPPAIYRSTDNGANWTKLDLQLPQNAITLTLAGGSGGKLFLGTTAGLFTSMDSGQTWQPVGGLPSVGSNFGIVASPSGTTVYASLLSAPDPNAESTIYISTDNGATWTQKTKLPFTQVYEILVEGPTVFIGHPVGVIRVNDGGANFEIKNKGLRSSSTFSDVLVLGNRVFVSSHGGGLWVTTDNGANWRQLKNGLPYAAFVSAVGAVGDTLFAALEQPFGFFRSTDFGETWTRAGTGLPPTDFTSFPTVITANDGKLYLGFTNKGLWVSSNNGDSFTQVAGGIPANAWVWSLAFKDNTIFVATNGTGLFRSMDGGNTFTASNTGLTVQFTRALLVAGNTLFLTASNGVYRSTDNGATWAPRLTNSFYNTITRSNGGVLYAASSGAGCWLSRDNGETWQVNNTALFGNVSRLATNGNQVILASQGSGVFFQTEDVFAAVSAASFSPNAVADKAIVSVFGVNLASSTLAASSVPLPTTLAGASVSVRDRLGAERPAPLFFVSPGQFNFQIPAGTATGTATVTITTSSGATVIGTADIKAAAPAIFALNASGTGAAAAVDAFTGALGPFSATQASGQPNIIAVFGTSLGGDATDLDANVSPTVTARLGTVAATVLYAGRAPGFVGANQFNIQLPASIVAGTYMLTLTRGGVTSNAVTITIR